MLSIESWVEREFIDYRYYGNPPTDMKVNCPFCGDDYKYHLHISINKQAVHCFRCGYSNSWIGLVMTITGLPYHQALGELYVTPKIRGNLKDNIIDNFAQRGCPDRVDEYLAGFSLPDDFELLVNQNTKIARLAKMYLKGRGFGLWHWKWYRLGIAPSQGHRVIIPIERDYWQGRAIHDWDKPKYLNPKSEAKDVIFNSAALELYDTVVVCEGAFSAMTVGESAVALIGKEPTRNKIERLIATDVGKYIIALEPKAYKTMSKLADALNRCGKQVEIWSYAEGDPADNGDYEVMDYGLKSRLSLAIQASKTGRSR